MNLEVATERRVANWPRPRLVLLPDHAPGVGAGHLARCLALAQAWLDHGGTASLVVGEHADPGWRRRYVDEGVAVVGAEQATGDVPSVVVTDGYQSRAPSRRYEVSVMIDDFGLSPVRDDLDVIVDQNGGPMPRTYLAARRVVSGSMYCLLRREFSTGRTSHEQSGRPRILISLGGRPGELEVAWAEKVVDRLQTTVDVEWLRHTDDVPAALARADVGLALAGSTTWELAWAGVPAVYVALTTNQAAVLERIRAMDLGLALGWLRHTDPADAAAAVESLLVDDQDFGSRARALVDGLGAIRTATVLRGELIRLRPVQMADCALLYGCRDRRTSRRGERRASARDPRKVSFEEHSEWFAGRHGSVSAAAAPSYIGEYAGLPIGQVRFEYRSAGEAEIDVSVAPDHRGRGWAAPLIDAACWSAFVEKPTLEQVTASVRIGNTRSRRSFVAAGFGPPEGMVSDESTLVTYARPRDDLVIDEDEHA
jgi:UDP-2,4-diacetamido-2,4,6-trideoxy-beta-L-altropyranose hydrolase